MASDSLRGSRGLIVTGVLLLLIGTTFALQGAGYIGGSYMTDNPFWTYAGSAIALIGAIFAAAGLFLRKTH